MSSKLYQLMQGLCPEGVGYNRLDEVLDYIQPGKYIVSDTQYVDDGIPVLTAGKTFVLGYTREKEGVYHACIEDAVIIFDDFTTSFQWVNFPFKVKSSAVKILIPKKTHSCLFRYVYYAMQCIGYAPREHARQWIQTYSKFEIPIPPLEVQEEIVRILDKFTELTAELTAELTTELTARRTQYEWYRDHLLEKHTNEGEYRPLEKVALSIQTGKLNANAAEESGIYPFFTCGRIPSKINTYAFDAEAILIAGNGNIGITHYYNGKFNAYQRTYVLTRFEDVVPRYLKYYIESAIVREVASKSKKGSVPYITLPMLQAFQVFIPPLAVQEEIVRKLDRFSQLTDNITEGLLAEIEARQKQYEYYRDKLLTFKPLNKA